MNTSNQRAQRRSILWIAALVIVGQTALTAEPAGTYVVKKGDTLASIAREHRITVAELLKANGLASDAVIREGQQLRLPGAAAPPAQPAATPAPPAEEPAAPAPAATPEAIVPPAAATIEYKVQAGDNLFRIAQKFNVPVEAVREANGLDEKSVLQIGQTLRIPGVAVDQPGGSGGQSARAVPPTVTTPPVPPPAIQPPPAGPQPTVTVPLTPDGLPQLPELPVMGQEPPPVLLPAVGASPPPLPQEAGGNPLGVPPAKPSERAAPEQPAQSRPAQAAPPARATPPAARSTGLPAYVTVSEPRIHLRERASIESASFGLVDQGQRLDVVGKSGGWWQVKQPDTGALAYVAGWVVKAGPGRTGDPPAVLPEYVVITEPRVHLRAGPSVEQRSLGLVDRGTRLRVTGKHKMWWRVIVPDVDEAGYVAGWVVAERFHQSQLETAGPRLAAALEEPAGVTVAAAEQAVLDVAVVAPEPVKSILSDTAVTAAMAPQPVSLNGVVPLLDPGPGAGGLNPDRDAPAVTPVANTQVTLRAEPSQDATQVASVVLGPDTEVIASCQGWLQIKAPDGTQGWVASHLVRVPAAGEAIPTAAAGTLGQRLVATAMSYRGIPYRSGGTSRAGVDCSGLVYLVCKQHGYNLPRRASQQWGHGQRIEKSALQPGDLVYFANTYRSGISHVGIYVGDGKFIHAPRPGRSVTVETLMSGYYDRHYAGAFRLPAQ